MGNIFGRKREVTQELENLTTQMKSYKTDIEKTFESKRMILWYMTMFSFFVTTSLIGYVWMEFNERQMQILLSIGSFIAGIVLLWFSRKVVNGFYDWRLNRKKKFLDDIIEKKKSILETVKETETFKVAKEILEKYDDQPVEPMPRAVSQPATPVMQKRILKPPPPPPGTPMNPQMAQNRPPPPPQHSPQKMMLQATPARSLQNIPMSTQRPQGPPRPMMPQKQPIRPFHREPTTAVDKVVDYFFSDGPNNRMALICTNCHGHNGMALPHEYEYLAFECFLCRHFNPAKKWRQTGPPPSKLETPEQLLPKEAEKSPADAAPETGESTDDEKIHDNMRTVKDEKEGTEEDFDMVHSERGTDDEETK